MELVLRMRKILDALRVCTAVIARFVAIVTSPTISLRNGVTLPGCQHLPHELSRLLTPIQDAV
jgi:hypothetical protein